MSVVGERIRSLREERDMNQVELADAIGINNSVLSRIETGKRPVEDYLLERFSDFFGVSTDYLLGRSDIRYHKKDLPQPVAPHALDGFDELSPAAKEEVLSYLDYIKVKYGKKEGKNNS